MENDNLIDLRKTHIKILVDNKEVSLLHVKVSIIREQTLHHCSEDHKRVEVVDRTELKRFITVGFDLLKSTSSYGNNEYTEIDIFSDSEKELERIFNLITKE